MPLENLLKLVTELRERMNRDRYRDVLRQREATTRSVLVEPFLNELGWDTEDPTLVRPEYRIGGNRRVDYALFCNGKPLIMLEAKSLDKPLKDAVKEDAVDQAIEYCTHTKAKYAVATDGRRWKIYKAQRPCATKEKGKPSFDPDSPWVEFDLMSTPTIKVCQKALALWMPDITLGHDEGIWQSLSELDYNKDDPSPTKIRFPDGSTSVPIYTWESILFQVARWLIENGHLSADACPVADGPGAVYYIVNTEPFHSNGTRFSSDFSDEANGLHIEGGDYPSLIDHTRRIIEQAGQNPAQFRVRFPCGCSCSCSCNC